MAAKNVLNWICRINPWLFRYFIRLTGNGRDGKQKLVHTDVEECLDDYTTNGTGIGIRPFLHKSGINFPGSVFASPSLITCVDIIGVN